MSKIVYTFPTLYSLLKIPINHVSSLDCFWFLSWISFEMCDRYYFLTQHKMFGDVIQAV